MLAPLISLIHDRNNIDSLFSENDVATVAFAKRTFHLCFCQFLLMNTRSYESAVY